MATKPRYAWSDAGEEWSRPWGNSTAQWFGAIYQRICACLPAAHVLEIACGFGRWTEFLRRHCERITAIDPAAECVAACRQRFFEDARVSVLQNDGSTIPLENSSVDFAFSFDSLVHTERETVESYVRELARVLKPEGRAFFHHSNLAAYPISARLRLPKPFRQLLENVAILTRTNQRAPDMSAEIFRRVCEREGLHCATQELIDWRSRGLIDCFSTVTRDCASLRLLRNPHFMREAELIRQRAHLYHGA